MEEGRSIVCCTATSQSRAGCVDNDCPGRWGQGWKNSFSSDLGTAITAQCYAIHMFVVRQSWTKVRRGLSYKCGTYNWILHIAHDDANKWPTRVDVCIGYPVLSMLISVCTASYDKTNFPVKWPQAAPSDCLLETIVITGSDRSMPATVPGVLQWDRLWRRQCCSDSWQLRGSLFLLWILHLNQS